MTAHASPGFTHVLVTGLPGSGKSTLLHAILAQGDLVGARPLPRHVLLWHGGKTPFRFTPRGRGLPKAYEMGTSRSIRVDLVVEPAGNIVDMRIRRDHVGAKPFERHLCLARDTGSWAPTAARAVLEVIEEVDRGA